MSFTRIVSTPETFTTGASREARCTLAWLMTGLVRVAMVLLLAAGLSACERAGKSLAEEQYSAAIIGHWQGNVGEESESIRFAADGSFSAQLSSNGFIGATLGQRATGTVRGSWSLQGDVITLTVAALGNEQPLSPGTSSTIVSFNQNQLVVKSESGETSTFTRAM